MSGYEAKAYVTLVGAGQPLNGYEVAKRSGVPRSTVYETLGKLVAKGAAYELRGADDATDYLPLPPRSLLERLRREFDDSIEALESSLPAIVAPPGAHLIHSLKDAGALLARAEDVIAGARADLFLSIWPEEMKRLAPLVKRAAERGVDTSVLHFGPVADPVGHMYEHRFPSLDEDLEEPGRRLLVVAADRRETLVGGFAGDTAWGVYTEDPAVVTMAVEYVGNDIVMQVIAERVGHETMRGFWADDPRLAHLRAARDRYAALVRAAGPPARPEGSQAAPLHPGDVR
ncbi:sugar-specific transcriptional regulator TrmB [Streptosporangium becharense]|uniref:Sugar-specific transcriptional regulator TrmB n=2 Tax=Streptosporangium becharense TaxID=1816182 RepID=A0A7W9IE99_9ACTN|nr:sugar-specific transcriptional regulator TrmB [Streptosporangium becharense]MBB5818870.1 sugar-specific transcriptional regulator TrmB [Streptosporangium becharense]